MTSARKMLEKSLQSHDRHIQMLLGSKAIANHIGLSQRDVLHLLKTGALPGMKIGNKFVCDKASIERWLAEKMLRNLLSQ